MRSVEEITSNKRFIYSDHLVFSEDGFKGFMTVDNIVMTFVASWGCGWDHVSVAPTKGSKVPTWQMMCKVKDVFFKDDEAVIQIHPPKDQYINNLNNCLHLWRANDKDMLLPPSFMVGLKRGQSLLDVEREYEQYCRENGYKA